MKACELIPDRLGPLASDTENIFLDSHFQGFLRNPGDLHLDQEFCSGFVNIGVGGPLFIPFESREMELAKHSIEHPLHIIMDLIELPADTFADQNHLISLVIQFFLW